MLASNCIFRRCARLQARSHTGTLLIADSLKGADMTDEVKCLIVKHLGLPALAARGACAHLERGQA